MFKNKRAVSPLVATLLLVVFAIALGSIIMSYGKISIKEGEDMAGESYIAREPAPVKEITKWYNSGEITKEQYQKIKDILAENH